MGDLQPVRAEFQREIDQRGRLPDIVAMRRRVDRQGQARFPDPARHLQLFVEALLIVTDLVGDVSGSRACRLSCT